MKANGSSREVETTVLRPKKSCLSRGSTRLLALMVLVYSTTNQLWVSNSVFLVTQQIEELSHSLEQPHQQQQRSNSTKSRGSHAAWINVSSAAHPFPTLLNQSELIRQMKAHDLTLSLGHQKRFHKRRTKLLSSIPHFIRYPPNLGQWAANRLTDDYAYLHIFKNGGTTVATQTKRGHQNLTDEDIQQRKWITVVRDPIDHFLSGWAEVAPGVLYEQDGYNTTTKNKKGKRVLAPYMANRDYNHRVLHWLEQVKDRLISGRCRTPSWCAEVHSFPQANFMMTEQGAIAPQLEMVGDLRELPAVVSWTGFDYRPALMGHRNASADDFLSTHFPKDVSRLKISTLREICRFVALDYYLFDFTPHPACRQAVNLANSFNQSIRKTWVDRLPPKTRAVYLKNRYASQKKSSFGILAGLKKLSRKIRKGGQWVVNQIHGG